VIAQLALDGRVDWDTAIGIGIDSLIGLGVIAALGWPLDRRWPDRHVDSPSDGGD